MLKTTGGVRLIADKYGYEEFNSDQRFKNIVSKKQSFNSNKRTKKQLSKYHSDHCSKLASLSTNELKYSSLIQVTARLVTCCFHYNSTLFLKYLHGWLVQGSKASAPISLFKSCFNDKGNFSNFQ